MQLSEITGCVNTWLDVLNMQFTLANFEEDNSMSLLTLDRIGAAAEYDRQCKSVILAQDEYVSLIKVGYKRLQIRSMIVFTNTGQIIQWGEGSYSYSKQWNFSQDDALAGIYGSVDD